MPASDPKALSKGFGMGIPKSKSTLSLQLTNSSVQSPFKSELLDLTIKNNWSNESLENVLSFLRSQSANLNPADLQLTASQLRASPSKRRPMCAVFTHSLERNGANNFALYVVRNLLGTQDFVIYSPKEGPMREDFESHKFNVIVLDDTAPDFLITLENSLEENNVGVMLANTIMRCNVVILAAKMSLPSVWVIHESWPQDQFDYYAKEVSMPNPDPNSAMPKTSHS